MAELLGRFHPLIVHLPIGILSLAFFMELASRFERYAHLKTSRTFILQVLIAATLFSWLTGWVMPKEGEFDESLIRLHFWSSVSLTVSIVLLYFLAHTQKANLQKAYLPLFSFAMFLLALTGHYGGSLTHGVNHLTAPLTSETPVRISDVNVIEIYDGIVQPIFKKKCYSCHNEGKLKGGLLMSTVVGLQKGGDGGPIFIAGNAENSEVVKRLHLPLEDELHMPPEGKVQFTKQEIKLLEWWINAGADFKQKVGEVEQPKAIAEILKGYEQHGPAIDTRKLKAPSPQVIADFAAANILVSALEEESPLVYVSLSRDTTIDRRKLKKLQSIAENITELDLSFSNMNDELLATLASFKNLTQLRLQHTAVTSKGLQHLEELEYLQSLNLYGTAIDDRSFASFQKMEALQNLFLWQSEVSNTEVATYAAAHPLVKVSHETNKDIFGEAILSPPLIVGEESIFDDTMRIEINSNLGKVKVYYTVDGTNPDSTSLAYKAPFLIDKTAAIKAISVKKGWTTSLPAEAVFIKQGPPIEAISLSKLPSDKYRAKGRQSLIDREKGSKVFSDGRWLGYEGEHVTATLDMGEVQAISNVVVGALEDTGSYIFFPKEIEVATSKDGRKFEGQKSLQIPTATQNHVSEVKSFFLNFAATEARFVQVKILGNLKNPAWHSAPGAKNWVFIDEILIN